MWTHPGPPLLTLAAGAAVTVMVGGAAAQPAAPAAWFPDRPVAWQEHDDGDVPRAPAPNDLQEWAMTLLLRDSLANEVDRILALEDRQPARDVNALDEVPCSTWFCPRNHLAAMSPAAVAAGPAADAPRLPLRIVKGKEEGATPGFQVLDAAGRRFMMKVDPAGHLGLLTGAEIVGGRLFHAAGYNVPAAFVLHLAPDELKVDPKATFNLYRVQKRPLSAAQVERKLAPMAHTPDGRLRVVLVPWVAGKILGGFDMIGRREDDPNDRIPHEHRRSLRATWLLMAWLAVLDPSAINTIDSYVEEGGRRFVRHHIFDFGAGLGSSTTAVKGPHHTHEYVLEVGRTLGALAGLGLYRRPFQDDREEWERLVTAYPSAGWFPAEGFDPELFRSNRKVPAHLRRTDRDLYWGAKLVMSFTDAQIDAVVDEAQFPAPDDAWVKHALRVRRDIIGRRYLRAATAVEQPAVSADGGKVCFLDLAVSTGLARADRLRYAVEVEDGRGGRLAIGSDPATGSRTCLTVPFARDPRTGYRIVAVRTQYGDGITPATGKAARIHLRWRAHERRFVVVGLDRDE